MYRSISERIRGIVSLFWREVAKFGTVGGIAFIVDNGLYWWLINGPMDDSVVKARFVSASVATLFSWVANRYWTFRQRRQANVVRELTLFIVINVIGMIISAGCVWIARYPLEITDRTLLLFAGIVGTVLATVMRFFAYRFLVFTAELDADPAYAGDHEIFEHRHAENVAAERREGTAPEAEGPQETDTARG